MKIIVLLSALFVAACSDRSAPPEAWQAWSRWVEERSPVSDGQGHGPDIGSEEWARALQQKLGITDPQGHGPDIGSGEWRNAVEEKLTGN